MRHPPELVPQRLRQLAGMPSRWQMLKRAKMTSRRGWLVSMNASSARCLSVGWMRKLDDDPPAAGAAIRWRMGCPNVLEAGGMLVRAVWRVLMVETPLPSAAASEVGGRDV